MQRILSLILFILLCPGFANGVDPWPGEPWQQSQIITNLDDNFVANLSGAHWNGVTRTLWVCVNGPGSFVAIVEDGVGGWKVANQDGKRGEFSPGGDLEGLTQADLAEPSVYLLAEGEDVVRKYDVSVLGTVKLLKSWSLKPHVPTSGGSGSEGIAFVPDVWLRSSGFVDKNGQPYASKLGMGGLMFIAHQNGGRVYVFDLSTTTSDVLFVGSYVTSRSESSGLEFDRSTGRLWVWHNIDANYLEVVSLASDAQPDGSRRLHQFVEYAGPKGGNLEGFAMSPEAEKQNMAFVVDDGNSDGAALMVFRKFLKAAPKSVDVRISARADDAEENSVGVVSLNSTDLEFVQDGSNVQTAIGLRFPTVQIPPGAKIVKAYVQFSTDETSSVPTNLVIRGQAAVNAPTFTATKKNVSNRPKTIASVTWAPPAWSILDETSVNQRTPDLSSVIQEMIGLPGWVSGGSLVLIVTGAGKRVAEAVEGSPARAPLLHVEFE